MLLNMVNHLSEEYFLCGSQHAKDFELLKKQCFLGWTTVSACVRIWTVTYTSENRIAEPWRRSMLFWIRQWCRMPTLDGDL